MQTKPLSWDQIRANAAAFVHEWAGESYERGESQSFWTELFAVYGIRRRKVAQYESRAKKADGGAGFIDVFWPGMLIAEQKSLGKDLVAAEDQALTYLANVPEAEQPRYVITCDFETFRLRDLEAPAGDTDAVVEFPLEQLPVEAERLGFIAGYQKRTFGSAEQAAASVKAAQLMADLYVELEGSGYDEHEASVFLVRTLFALFADDSGLWERDLFLEFIQTRTAEDGSDLGAQLTALFQVLNRPVNKRMAGTDELMLRFPYVNGSVFGEPVSIPYFTASMRQKLIAACHFNWGGISPAIFGSLFQAVKSKEARRELGEHYTTEENILKLIGPLFLDELRAEFVANIHSRPGLRKLHERLGQMRFLDPACGCGNFLIVAYRELRALELQILVRLQELSGKQVQTSLVMDEDERVRVRMSHFNGIELEEWPATIARTAMFLVNHQANQDMSLKIGVSPEQLPLTESAHILVGNALRLDWNDVVPASEHVYVMGNPPFIGQYTKTAEQTADMKAVWDADYDGYLDYVTGWHAQAMHYFADQPVGRFAFVTTNSIAQGQPVPALFGPLHREGWTIPFAHRTFAWSSEAPGAAGVHCVIVGFSKGIPLKGARLFSYERSQGQPVEEPVTAINPYLVEGPWVLVGKRSKPLAQLPAVLYGCKPADGGAPDRGVCRAREGGRGSRGRYVPAPLRGCTRAHPRTAALVLLARRPGPLRPQPVCTDAGARRGRPGVPRREQQARYSGARHDAAPIRRAPPYDWGVPVHPDPRLRDPAVLSGCKVHGAGRLFQRELRGARRGRVRVRGDLVVSVHRMAAHGRGADQVGPAVLEHAGVEHTAPTGVVGVGARQAHSGRRWRACRACGAPGAVAGAALQPAYDGPGSGEGARGTGSRYG